MCGPDQSKRTWTFHKSHFVWKFKGKMPAPRCTPRLDTGPFTVPARTPSVWPHCLGKKHEPNLASETTGIVCLRTGAQPAGCTRCSCLSVSTASSILLASQVFFRLRLCSLLEILYLGRQDRDMSQENLPASFHAANPVPSGDLRTAWPGQAFRTCGAATSMLIYRF